MTVPGHGPLEVVVGFGRGRFLRERALEVPEHRLLGIEIKTKWSYLVHARCDRDGLDNVTVFCGDVRTILERMSASSIWRTYVNFPDPWWKKRHRKRRVIGPDLVRDLARLTEPGGELFIQTDVAERAADYVRDVRDVAAFRLLSGRADGLLDGSPVGARSNREVRAEQDGLPIYRLLAKCDAGATR